MKATYHPSWQAVLAPILSQPYMQKLSDFVERERAEQLVFPAERDVFKAFELTPLDAVKVVILGQDPYHNLGQAQGLAFSVPAGMALPPSLKNMYKELTEDIPGFTCPKSGDLSAWAAQGVLLLNATLTVRAHEPASHQKQGWEQFTDQILAAISEKQEAVVFLLWGAAAQQKAKLLDAQKHLLLKAVHPSPLSAYRGFFGCKHFSQANAYLSSKGKAGIDWSI